MIKKVAMCEEGKRDKEREREFLITESTRYRRTCKNIATHFSENLDKIMKAQLRGKPVASALKNLTDY